ncbi:MAG: ROK family protein, partial [Bacteroidaceae bacterium]|nr:ROK family protein [Bacteroidaceae bacterium]
AHDLDLCLQNMKNGFAQVFDQLEEKPVAISFAFPGPADYPNGIIGGYLPNFPSFRDGVALGAFLEKEFGVPVFINNDGDLFAYGEALCGALPEINNRLTELGSNKQYKNLIGYTLGTGFGIGVVIDGRLNRGDNSCVETFCLRHRDMPDVIVEDGVAIRAVCRVYGEKSGNMNHGLTPKDICEIADGKREGDVEAAKEAFASLGRVAGAAISTAVTIIDGLVVIGGGVSAASHWIMPALLEEMRSKLRTLGGDEVNLVQMNVYNLEDDAEFAQFAQGEVKKVKVYGEERYVDYDSRKRIGIAISKLGASKAVSVGAYAFALSELDKR